MYVEVQSNVAGPFNNRYMVDAVQPVSTLLDKIDFEYLDQETLDPSCAVLKIHGREVNPKLTFEQNNICHDDILELTIKQ